MMQHFIEQVRLRGKSSQKESFPSPELLWQLGALPSRTWSYQSAPPP